MSSEAARSDGRLLAWAGFVGVTMVLAFIVSLSTGTPANARSVARLLGGSYRELACAGGHMWMLDSWPILAGILGQVDAAVASA